MNRRSFLATTTAALAGSALFSHAHDAPVKKRPKFKKAVNLGMCGGDAARLKFLSERTDKILAL